MTSVYTCQKPQHKRCGFFLWDDDAKPREEAALLCNSRTEPSTPTKHHTLPLYPELDPPPTPTNTQARSASWSGPSKSPLKSPATSKDPYDSFDIDDEALSKVADEVSMPPPVTPRKAIKSHARLSPGKGRFEPDSPGSDADDIFTTPSTGMRGRTLFSNAGLMSPAETPTPSRFKDMLKGPDLGKRPPVLEAPDLASKAHDSKIGTEVLDLLRDLSVELNKEAIEGVLNIGSRWNLQLKGVEKGRDVSRKVIQDKNVRMTELQARIDALEAERENHMAVIRNLRKKVGGRLDDSFRMI